MYYRKMNFRVIVGFSLGFMLALGQAGCQRGGVDSEDIADVIRIGEVSPQTGVDAAAGASIHHGVELLIRQINEKGGIRGKKLELISMDDQGKPEQSALAVTKLITQKKVLAVVGTLSSSGSIAMAPIAQNHKVPLVSPTATHPKVTETGDYIFRACFTEPFQGSVLARFAYQKLGVRKVAILYDLKSDYSTGLTELFTSTFKSLGGEVISRQSYSAGDMDFKAQLTLIRSKKPEAIFLPNYFTDVGLIARQVRELGIQVPLLGGDAWDSPKLVEVGGQAVENGYFSNHYSDNQSSPKAHQFIKSFKEAYGTIPDGPAALSYDAAALLVEAIEKAKSLKPADIRDALSQTKNFQGVTGQVSLDAHRNPIKSAVIVQVEKGQFKYKMTLDP